MKIVPMRDLKNTVEIERKCAEENGSVFVTKNGYGRLVVMDIEYYERNMASDRYNYVLTESADADIDDAFDNIANELVNPDAASAFVDELEEKLEEICKTPKAGRPIHNPYLKRDDVRRVLVKNNIAYYLIDEEKENIVVLRVVYNRRNQDKISKTI